MTPEDACLLSPVQAMRRGRRTGYEAALAGASPRIVLAVALKQPMWQRQEPDVRTSFAWAVEHAYDETLRGMAG